MVSRRTTFGERSEPAPDGGGKLQSAGGRHKVTFRHCKAALATAQQAIITVQVALTVSFSKCSMAKI